MIGTNEKVAPDGRMELLRDFLQYINIVDMEDIEIVQQGGLNYEI